MYSFHVKYWTRSYAGWIECHGNFQARCWPAAFEHVQNVYLKEPDTELYVESINHIPEDNSWRP